jgi:hypothetical protein
MTAKRLAWNAVFILLMLAYWTARIALLALTFGRRTHGRGR